MSSYTKPLPEIDPYSKGFWTHAHSHRLSVQVCAECGQRTFPASPVCPACLSDALDWKAVSGRGTLISWVTFHRAYWDSFRSELPYHVCVVELEEGPLVVGNFVNGIPDGVRMGMPMRAVFEDVTADISLLRFAPT
ncbi:Zn-ribbon domain-containing OB-fold protein [Caballeronia sp. GaOx3]|uniref:Zn-ribbon domain-containing OB-fold protein n=1 Tax=Caballeronia sp. GaOx3 TaxID=2921740 RepID=UPI0020287E64|nr:OB-fold domain-containing protein [Caballeronia sp. GaOx3]